MALSGRARLQLACCLLFLLSVFDLAVSTLLLLRVGVGHPKESLVNQVVHYNFGVSSFDLWLLSVLRAVAFASLVLVFCCKHQQQVVVLLKWLKRLSPVLVVAAVITFCASVAKLLASFEFYEDGTPVHGGNSTNLTSQCEYSNSSLAIPACEIATPHQRQPVHPWMWALLAWMSITGTAYLLLYRALASIKAKQLVLSRLKSNQIQVDEYTPLINAIRDDSSLSSEAFDEEEIETPKTKSSWSILFQLIGYTRPDALWYIGGFIFLVIGSAAMSFIPYYTGQVINHIAISPSTTEFKQAIIVMSAITLVSAVCAGMRAGLLIIAHGRLNVRIRNRLFAALICQEIGFFDASETGDLTSRLTSDTTKMADQIGIQLNLLLRMIIQSLGSIVFMVKLTWKLSTVTLVGIPIITIVAKYYGVLFKYISKAIQDSLAKANNVAEESLSSMKTVRSFANESAEMTLFKEKLNLTFSIYKRKAWAYGTYMSNTQLLQLVLQVVLQVVTLYYGGHLVISQEMSGGELVSLLLYQVSLAASLDAMSTVFTGVMEAVGAAEKVFELIDRSPGINHDSGHAQPDTLQGVVEFRNVSFAYPTRPDVLVLHDVSFKAEPGQVIALVGPSGGGKSSCINLLERFYEPLSGEVLLDGKPLSHYDHQYLHTRISLVGQEPVLYARSISENIKYGMRTEASEEMVRYAAEMANAHEFVVALTEGYGTQTGEKGAQLSGGQKQRVAIARALIRNPTVLLLDEATSALDAESEHLVQQALSRNFKGRTVIVIAHRLSTVERADRIIVINKGGVLEQGTHQELLARGGLYAKLVRKQMVQDERKERKRPRSQSRFSKKKAALSDDKEEKVVDQAQSQSQNGSNPHSSVLEPPQDSEEESVSMHGSNSSINSTGESSSQ